MNPIIYLDMDGVLFDFDGWSERTFGSCAAFKAEIESPNWGKFKDYPNLFELLPPMHDAMALYEGCCEFIGDKNRVQCLTALPNRAMHVFPDAARHKIESVHRHISKDLRVHFGPFAQDKQYHCKHSGDILIDDMIRNIDQWNSAGGIGILHLDTASSLEQLKGLK